MSGIDWDKAPEDAQGYMPQDNLWYAGWWKDESGSRYFWSQAEGDQGGWRKSFANPFDHPQFIARPSPSWSSEGLPPAGMVCEWFSPVYGWLGGKVIGHDGTVTVVAHNDGYTGCHPHEVRPIRTPEQIAADEREAAISEFTQFFMNYYGDPKGAEKYYLVSRSLHDAGYRKHEDQK